jgi:hypothetical protein
MMHKATDVAIVRDVARRIGRQCAFHGKSRLSRSHYRIHENPERPPPARGYVGYVTRIAFCEFEPSDFIGNAQLARAKK